MHPADTNPLLRWAGPAGAAAVGLIAIAVLSTLGLGRFAPAGIATVLQYTMLGGGVALVYLLSAVGYGRLPAFLLRRAGVETGLPWIQLSAGLALLLWLSHLSAMGGLFAPDIATIAGWGVLGVGLLLLADQVGRGDLRPERWPVAPASLFLVAPALGLMLVAASSPPGWLWESEAGAYDVLSYHLQLPKEWSVSGRLWPVEHNVYSYLPSYMEAAYMHLNALHGGGKSMLEGEGIPIFAAQYLHVLIGVAGAVTVGRAAWTLCERLETPPAVARFSGVIAGASLLSIPWVVVTGSLAYNELAVVTLAAGALLVALIEYPPERSGASLGARWILAGWLVGIACSAKPTALFLVTPSVGLLLLTTLPADLRRRLPGLIGLSALAALVAMAPWLIRNWMAGGNPVFPFATGLFGPGHWTLEQIERYSTAHRADAGLVGRIALAVSRERGLFHPQWLVAFPVGVVGLAALLAFAKTRAVGGALLIGILIQLLAWGLFTHIQSRFLLPFAPLLALGCGVGAGVAIASLRERAGPVERVAVVVTAMLPISLGAWSGVLFATQRDGQPNARLPGGIRGMRGDAALLELGRAPRTDRIAGAMASPISEAAIIRLVTEPGVRAMLLGDATPLYFDSDVLYNTTYDTWPLGELIRAHPDDPAAWSAALRASEIGVVLVCPSELARLHASGYADPDVTPAVVVRWMREACDIVPVQPWTPSGAEFANAFGAAPADADLVRLADQAYRRLWPEQALAPDFLRYLAFPRTDAPDADRVDGAP